MSNPDYEQSWLRARLVATELTSMSGDKDLRSLQVEAVGFCPTLCASKLGLRAISVAAELTSMIGDRDLRSLVVEALEVRPILVASNLGCA